MPAMTWALVETLQTIADPRRQCANLKHPLVDIIILGFCGVLGGCEDFVEIAEWAQVHEEAFRSFLELPHGIPAHDTFTRVFALLKPATLPEVLLPWLLERRGLPGDWIHVDGKTLRQTGRTTPKLKALHVVSAWAGQTGITLGQVAVDAKSNEITAMPELLKLLDLQEKIVTTDAMGCQKEIAQTIVAGGGDYIFAVKDNQPTLHAEIQAAFAIAPPQGGLRASIPLKSRGTGGRNSVRCRCCPRGGRCRRHNGRCGWGCSRLSWSHAWCGVR
jgi:DDE_Tnp_1-associated/Transposase DDE domain